MGADVRSSSTAEIGTLSIVPGFQAHLRRCRDCYTAPLKFFDSRSFGLAAAVREAPQGGLSKMRLNWRMAGLAVCTGALIAAAAYAQSPTALEQAELAGLSPEMRAQVQARAVGGNSVTEVLQVMLLNNIKIKHPANQIVAMDWGRGVAVVEPPGGGMAVVHFDPTTLQIK